MTREGDRKLYEQTWGVEKAALASVPKNDRVRAMLEEELEKVVPRPPGGPTKNDWGHARGQFVRDWVALCAKLGIKGPGDERRAPLGDFTLEERQLRAAHTRVEQFLEGHLEYDWVLVGIESTICDRRGLALPPEAYQTQEKLDV